MTSGLLNRYVSMPRVTASQSGAMKGPMTADSMTAGQRYCLFCPVSYTQEQEV